MTAAQATASVTLFSSDQGGRRGPTPADWFSCALWIEGRTYDVRMKLGASLELGVKSQVDLVFLDPMNVRQILRDGLNFDIWEGRVIGTRQIIRVRAWRAEPGRTSSGPRTSLGSR